MALTPGTKFGPYEIVASIGSGGMGEVYRARDSRLGRDVALKVLAGPLANDPDRRQRFEREAKAVAALNHPNIVTIHSIEQIGGEQFLTMELVEGKALSELIPAAGLPFDRLLKIAVPMSDAVGAAHRRGITHRDLKPSNVMVTHDGRVKILDFGLAAYHPDGATAGSVLTSPALTHAGVILGTVAYMSPEQAEGKPVDEHSDIFSLGVTLYEMATGRRPFTGDTGLSIMSAILRDTPQSVADLSPSVPRGFDRIVRRCLEKDPERRYHSAKDLRNDLEELSHPSAAEATTSGAVHAPAVRRTGAWSGRSLALLAVVALVGIAAGYAVRSAWQPASTAPFKPEFSQLTWDAGIEQFPSLSPDAKWVVYSGDASGNEDIYLQSVSGQTAINLTRDSPANDRQPAFSPDGERIVFRSEREGGGIFVMGRTGEATRRISSIGFNPAWAPDGSSIVVATEGIVRTPESRGPNSTLWIVDVATGERRELKTNDAVQPHWSPNGHRIAYWTAGDPGRPRNIATIAASGGEPVPVTNDPDLDWNPVWSADGGHLYFLSRRGGIMSAWRVPIDERSGRTLGPIEPVVMPTKHAVHLSVSRDGRHMAFSAMDLERNVEVLALDPAAGAFTREKSPVTLGSRSWSAAEESSDGQWVVLQATTPHEDLFIMRADGSGLRQVTNDVAFDRLPRWAPDGKRIAFQSNRGGAWEVWGINPDGSGLAPFTKALGGHEPLWAPDGARLIFNDFLEQHRPGIIDVRQPLPTTTHERLPAVPGTRYWLAEAWSPNGQFLAGLSDGTGLVVYSLETRSFTTFSERSVGQVLAWLADSRRVLFNDRAGISILDRESKKVRLLQPPVTSQILSLSRDNRRLYVSKTATRGDVWMAALR